MLQLITNILITSSIYLIISIAFYLHYRFFNFFNFAIAGYLTISSYFFYLFISVMNFGLFYSLIFSILSSVSIAFIIEYVFLLLKIKKTSSLYLLVISMGVYTIIESLISIIYNNNAKVINELDVVFLIKNSFITLTLVQASYIFSAIIIISFFVFFSSSFLLSLKGVFSNPSLSVIFGTNYKKIGIYQIIIYLLLLSISGIIIGLDKAITPSVGFSFFLFGIITTILSGLKIGFKHLLFGALLLSLFQNLIAYYVGYKWINLISFVLLILFLAFRPYGISNYKMKKAEI